jgi:hypothetical protein
MQAMNVPDAPHYLPDFGHTGKKSGSDSFHRPNDFAFLLCRNEMKEMNVPGFRAASCLDPDKAF